MITTIMKGWLRSIYGFRIKLAVIFFLLSGLVGARHWPQAINDDSSEQSDFSLAAPQGFGDRQNSWAWSMQWWNGHLYVGTNRAFHCAEIASLNSVFPDLFPYPPPDPDIECTPDPADLPLQAEIWRWTPQTDQWERVFQSPSNVPIPDRPGKFVARDVGIRGLNVFTESDSTEALYAAMVSPKFLWPNTLSARILRSTDGVNFEPIPQDPGTAFGDYPFASLRNQLTFRDRFYVTGGIIQGSGVLLESENPAGGNDNFRIVSPAGQVVSAAVAFNDYLYLGIRDFTNGYSVIKTDADGPLPYVYSTVVEPGAFLPGQTNIEVLSMTVFNNRLYVGSNGLRFAALGLMGPAELIRINPDDTWEVVVGKSRLAPGGWMFPVSGYEAGFGNFYNGHMWRMEVFDNNLFVGTFDSSTTFKDDPEMEPVLRHLMGFDLYRTPNGIDFFPITTNGLGDMFNFGVRSLESTPYGLFLGTANYYYGLQIWRAQEIGDAPDNQTIYLPLITKS